jgi:hypothetical protein
VNPAHIQNVLVQFVGGRNVCVAAIYVVFKMFFYIDHNG